MGDRHRRNTLKELGAFTAGGILLGVSLLSSPESSTEKHVQSIPQATTEPSEVVFSGLLEDLVDCDNGPFVDSLVLDVHYGDKIRVDNFVDLAFPSAGKGRISIKPGLEGAPPKVINGEIVYENSLVRMEAHPEVTSSTSTNLIVDLSCLS